MNVVIVPSPAVGARIVADHIEWVSKLRRTVVFGLATGSSPIPLYDELIIRGGRINWSRVSTFNLDEYHPIDPTHPESYQSFMDEHLFNRIDDMCNSTHVPDGQAKDVEDHCLLYEQLIIDSGGIDLQILGIGNNAHIAFNEPGSAFNSRTRRMSLDEATRQANKRFFDGDITKVPTHALTMGMGTIMEARQIYLLAWGIGKAEAIAASIEGAVSPKVPASLLQLHPNATFVVDAPAASLLRRNNYIEIAEY